MFNRLVFNVKQPKYPVMSGRDTAHKDDCLYYVVNEILQVQSVLQFYAVFWNKRFLYKIA